jgi:tRNA(fMet)-specific endonuclease VapC
VAVILDTNAVSALFAGDPELLPLLAAEPRLHLPAVVIGEYRYGLLRSRRRRTLAGLLDTLIAESRVLELDLETAERYAEVRDELRRQGAPIPENDVWIAALARQHELPVVTRDEHFDQVPGLDRRAW